jgi:3-dehydroquinate synthase
VGSPTRLELRHVAGATPITIGAGALAAAQADLGAWTAGRTLFLITSPRVWGLHGEALAPLVAPAARVVRLAVEEGEAAKSLATAETLWRAMLEAGGRRDSSVLAFGGGSVGDLAGFVAGCFLRGIGVAQVPTTLLAQADAAIGGKTAVDLPEAKNSVGLFHHPDMVVAEAGFLATLPPEEVRSGLVEAIKVAALFDLDLLARIERDLEALLAGDVELLGAVATASAVIKVWVVENDPDESNSTGGRRLLNFGHSLGHAIETVLEYRGLRHGEAVAYGMLFATRLAVARGMAAAEADRLRQLLGRLGLPPLPPLSATALVEAMARDKKAVERGLSWVLPARQWGRSGETCLAPAAAVAAELEVFLRDPFAG